ncbi:hypothetical protein GC176_13405 [bacterium]|nr:hypothetical protein [bacterium]
MKDVLAEVCAGSDENLSRITHATLTYESEGKWKGPSTPPGLEQIKDPLTREHIREAYQPETTSLARKTVFWDGLRLRVDRTLPPERKEYTIVGTEDAIVFLAPWLGTDKQYEPIEYVVRIRTREDVGIPDGHPLNQGVPMDGRDQRLAISDYLSIAQERNLDIDVSREGQLIRLLVDDVERKSRREFVIDPDQGYNAVTYRHWSTKRSDVEPDGVIESEYAEGPPGAFHMVHQTNWSSAGVSPSTPERIVRESETRLVDSDFSAPPDPSVFSLDGLGIPVGARIEDQITGETYHYGVDAPAGGTLDGIEWKASGPKNGQDWWKWVVLAAVMLCGGLFFVRQRYRSRLGT